MASKKNKAWTGTLSSVQSGQMGLFKDESNLRVAVLQLRGTKSVVQSARTVQWSSYGLSMVLDELNINIEKCTPANMHEYDVVLYSITSPVDQLSMVAEMPTIKHNSIFRAKTRVIVGGQGAYPVWALREIVDRVHFGRAEGVAKQVCLTNDITPFQYDPARDLEIEKKYLLRGNTAMGDMEGSVGCKQGCTFCQYTYTREIVGQKQNASYNAGKQGHTVAEDTFATIDLSKPGRKTTALDGWSQETRQRIRKGVTDNYIIKRLRNVTESINGTINMKVFQIVGYPWETPESIEKDIQRMREILAEADAPTKQSGRVLIMFLNTPFSPEPLTPMENDLANIYINWREVIVGGGKATGRNVYKGRNIEAFILPQISGSLTLLKRVAVNRGASADQLRALNKCKTIDEGMSVVPGIWEPGAGKRVSDYLSTGFALPKYKSEMFNKYKSQERGLTPREPDKGDSPDLQALSTLGAGSTLGDLS